MNHDITHCFGVDVRIGRDENYNIVPTEHIVCAKRDKCHRYKAYLDLPNIEGCMFAVIGLANDCIDNDYNLYWEEENGQP